MHLIHLDEGFAQTLLKHQKAVELKCRRNGNSKPVCEKQESPLELEFLQQVRDAGLPEPIRQYKALEQRRFLWDFAWPDEPYRLLIEVNGQTFRKGGHSTGRGIARDYEKLDLGILAGWHCLIFDAKMIHNGKALAYTRQALEKWGKSR